MSSIQSEITMYVSEQGNVTHNQEKVNRNRPVSIEMIGMVKIPNKDFKTAIVNMFKDLEEKISIRREETGNISRETDTLKKEANEDSKAEKYKL